MAGEVVTPREPAAPISDAPRDPLEGDMQTYPLSDHNFWSNVSAYGLLLHNDSNDEIPKRAYEFFKASLAKDRAALRAAPRSPVALTDMALVERLLRADLYDPPSTKEVVIYMPYAELADLLDACRAARAAEGKPPFVTERQSGLLESLGARKEARLWAAIETFRIAQPDALPAARRAVEDEMQHLLAARSSPPDAEPTYSGKWPGRTDEVPGCAVPGHAEAVRLAEAWLAWSDAEGVSEANRLWPSFMAAVDAYRAARRPSETGEALKPRTAAEVEKYAAIEDVNRRANEGLKRLTQPRTCAEARERGWIRHEEVVARANLAEALQSYVTNKRGLLALMDQIDAYLDERIRRASATGGEAT